MLSFRAMAAASELSRCSDSCHSSKACCLKQSDESYHCFAILLASCKMWFLLKCLLCCILWLGPDSLLLFPFSSFGLLPLPNPTLGFREKILIHWPMHPIHPPDAPFQGTAPRGPLCCSETFSSSLELTKSGPCPLLFSQWILSDTTARQMQNIKKCKS